MAEYVAGRGTTALSIIGTALGGLAATGNGLLGGTPCHGGSAYVNRYEMDLEKEIARKESEIAYWRGQDETNKKISDAYAKLENKIEKLEYKVDANRREQDGINLQQAVYNGTNTATISCIQNQVAALQAITKTVIPNSSVCPGWGDVTITPTTTPATAG